MNNHRSSRLPSIERVEASARLVPTDGPESDGTAEWDRTGVIVVRVYAGGSVGLGWTYAATAAAVVVREVLEPVLRGRAVAEIEGTWQAMTRAVRNAGLPGVFASAISAVDVAVWDLKARLLELSLVDLRGRVPRSADLRQWGFYELRPPAPYGALGGWVAQGIPRVKMKIGRDAAADPGRVAAARRAIGDKAELFVDANGAYSRKQALFMAERFAAESDVRWFEEPVSSDDHEGLRLMCERAPACMEIAAGEYGYTPGYFRRMLDAGAVDCVQADATRCGGYTGFLKVVALCEAYHLPLSAHCGPQLHAHVGCCAAPLRHVEYFHDHARIDRLLFEGTLEPLNGVLTPDRTRPEHGVTLNEPAAAEFAV